ncbi:hypothetical protein NIB75_20465 [Bacteroides uniformis]|nr:hypothetical protein [Bacteroides uniformis]
MIVGLAQKKNSGEIVVTTLANDAKISRTGTVEVVAGAEKVTVTVIQESAEDLDINTPRGIGWFGMMNLMRAHLLAMIGHTRFKEQGG